MEKPDAMVTKSVLSRTMEMVGRNVRASIDIAKADSRARSDAADSRIGVLEVRCDMVGRDTSALARHVDELEKKITALEARGR